jgi:hypothetical protein
MRRPHSGGLKDKINTSKRFVSVKFIIAFMQFRITIATNCRASTYYMKAIYVVGHEEARNVLFSVCRAYSVSTDNVLMPMYEVQYTA